MQRVFAPVLLLLLCQVVSAADDNCANGKCDQDDITSLMQLKQIIEPRGELSASPSLVMGGGRAEANGPINPTGDTMTTGKDWTCARSADYIACWGENDYGQLGFANRDSTNKPSGAAAFVTFPNKLAVAGAYHICAIKAGGNDDGKVKCWGKNNMGQLGYENTDDILSLPSTFMDLGTGITAKYLSLGDEHTCAILNNNQVKCWGRGDYGQLGNGKVETLGTAQNHMGDRLPEISLGNSRSAVMLASGKQHTCAILDNTQVKCWGQNNHGQLGYGQWTTSNRGQAINQMGQALPIVELGNAPSSAGGAGYGATKIFAGGHHTCAILTINSRTKCWGRNDRGQLGLGNSGDFPNIGTSSGQMGDSNVLTDLGYMTGTSTHGSVKTMALGDMHTCAIMDDSAGRIDRLKCWGGNNRGQLGYGNVADLGDEAGEMGAALGSVSLGVGRYALSISCGREHTCAILDNNDMKCWGSNSRGQLGNGVSGNTTEASIGDKEDEMGGGLPAVAPPPTPAPTTTTTTTDATTTAAP